MHVSDPAFCCLNSQQHMVFLLPGHPAKGHACCIVWCPIPFLSWIWPCIGHMGITSSAGVSYDFAGPYTVNEGHLLFGSPTRILQLECDAAACSSSRTSNGSGIQGVATAASQGDHAPDLELQQLEDMSPWDVALLCTLNTYEGRMYNLLLSNCHHMVVHFLNSVQYSGRSDWNIVSLACWVFLHARYTGWPGVIKTWAPFAALLLLQVLWGTATSLLAYCAAFLLLVAWFKLTGYCQGCSEQEAVMEGIVNDHCTAQLQRDWP